MQSLYWMRGAVCQLNKDTGIVKSNKPTTPGEALQKTGKRYVHLFQAELEPLLYYHIGRRIS